MISLAKRIMRRVRGHGRGKQVFSPREFLDMGNRAAVDKALSRLVAEGVLRRIGRGLYDWPRISSILNRPAPPNVQKAVWAIAKRDQLRVIPDGIVSANRLGLTNAVPAKTSYVTDRVTRTFKIGSRTVEFRHAQKILIAWFNRPGIEVIQALHWLGRKAAREAAVISLLRSRLSEIIKADLLDGLDIVPSWMKPIIKSVCSDMSVIV